MLEVLDEDLRSAAFGSMSGSVLVALKELIDGNLFEPALQATVFLPSSVASKSKDVTHFPVVEEHLLYSSFVEPPSSQGMPSGTRVIVSRALETA